MEEEEVGGTGHGSCGNGSRLLSWTTGRLPRDVNTVNICQACWSFAQSFFLCLSQWSHYWWRCASWNPEHIWHYCFTLRSSTRMACKQLDLQRRWPLTHICVQYPMLPVVGGVYHDFLYRALGNRSLKLGFNFFIRGTRVEQVPPLSSGSSWRQHVKALTSLKYRRTQI